MTFEEGVVAIRTIGAAAEVRGWSGTAPVPKVGFSDGQFILSGLSKLSDYCVVLSLIVKDCLTTQADGEKFLAFQLAYS